MRYSKACPPPIKRVHVRNAEPLAREQRPDVWLVPYRLAAKAHVKVCVEFARQPCLHEPERAEHDEARGSASDGRQPEADSDQDADRRRQPDGRGGGQTSDRQSLLEDHSGAERFRRDNRLQRTKGRSGLRNAVGWPISAWTPRDEVPTAAQPLCSRYRSSAPHRGVVTRGAFGQVLPLRELLDLLVTRAAARHECSTHRER